MTLGANQISSCWSAVYTERWVRASSSSGGVSLLPVGVAVGVAAEIEADKVGGGAGRGAEAIGRRAFCI